MVYLDGIKFRWYRDKESCSFRKSNRRRDEISGKKDIKVKNRDKKK